MSNMAESTYYDRRSPKSPRYDPLMPKAFKIGKRNNSFWQDEVETWLQHRAEVSRGRP